MTITIDAVYAGIILSVILAGLGGYGVLLIIIWQSIGRRLQTLGHEDRDIRGQLHGVLTMMEAHHRGVSDAILQSNRLIVDVYNRSTSFEKVPDA